MAKREQQLVEQADRIRQLRKAARLPQPDVADAVGVSLRAYQAWEAGDSNLGTRNLTRLAEFHGVSPDFIEHGELQPAQPSEMLERREDYYDRLNRLEQELRKLNAALVVLFSDRVLMAATERDIAEARRQLAGGSRPPAA